MVEVGLYEMHSFEICHLSALFAHRVTCRLKWVGFVGEGNPSFMGPGEVGISLLLPVYPTQRCLRILQVPQGPFMSWRTPDRTPSLA